MKEDIMKTIVIMIVLVTLLVSCSGGPSDNLTDNKVFDDSVNDTTLDFIDIRSCTVDITSSNITIAFDLVNVPDTLLFNSSTLSDNNLEYSYSVEFDTTGDGTTNYSISVSHFKPSGSSEINGDLLNNTQKTLWRHSGSSASLVSNLSATLVGNLLTVTAPKSLDSALSTLSIENICEIKTQHDNGVTYSSDDISL